MLDSDKKVLEAKIKATKLFTLTPTLTVCVIVMNSGFILMGRYDCNDTSKYNQEHDDKLAYTNALDKLYELEDYHRKLSTYEEDMDIISNL